MFVAQIAKFRKERKDKGGDEIVLSGSDEDSDDSLSDDEMVADDIKVRKYVTLFIFVYDFYRPPGHISTAIFFMLLF